MDGQQCDRCSSPSTPCTQPSCLIPELTAECTDECLVLACDDPDHGQQTCLVTNGDTPCDGTCITAAACNDCTGIDEIVSISFSTPLTCTYTYTLSFSVAPTTTLTSPSKSRMTLRRLSAGILPLPIFPVTAPKICSPSILPPFSLRPYKLSSPIHPSLLALPHRPPFRLSRPISIPHLHFPYIPPPPSPSIACGQIATLSLTAYPV